ncbi:zinc ribbon domain-containing protein [candidate division TA06 bacterium]|uniref:Zinc ribbon domain-containing protein n=1 Tax=candidate division TA06 bacterium TaxID=2250710 RepID=A0A933MJT6_UNCT6|nr:zinc ribbon domain-containing protein [candidate division TA06 bacterium]
MPIYEYQCLGCKSKVSLLILNPSTYGLPKCPKCGSEKLERLMSRFRTLRSEESRMERLADPSSFSGVDENDPASVARWAKKMGRELGDEAGEGFDEMVDQTIEEDLHKSTDKEESFE